MNRRIVASHLLSFAALLCWTSANVFTRLALAHFSPLPLATARYVTASLALIALGCVWRIGLPRARDLWRFFASGGIGTTLNVIAFNMGLLTISSATSAVVMALSPVFTALLAVVLFNEKLRPVGYLSIFIAFGGIVLLGMDGSQLGLSVGVLWTLGAAITSSLYNLQQRALLRRYTPLQCTTYSIVAGTLLLCVFFLPATVRELRTAPPDQLFNVAFLGVVPGAIGYSLWTVALSFARRTSDVTTYLFLSPVFAAIWAFLFGGEIPTASVYLGGGVILLGLLLFNLFGRKGPADPPIERP